MNDGVFFGFFKLNVEDVAQQYIDNWEDDGEKYNPANGCICMCDDRAKLWVMNGDWYCMVYVEDAYKAQEELNIAYTSIGTNYCWKHATLIAYNERVV